MYNMKCVKHATAERIAYNWCRDCFQTRWWGSSSPFVLSSPSFQLPLRCSPADGHRDTVNSSSVFQTWFYQMSWFYPYCNFKHSRWWRH